MNNEGRTMVLTFDWTNTVMPEAHSDRILGYLIEFLKEAMEFQGDSATFAAKITNRRMGGFVRPIT